MAHIDAKSTRLAAWIRFTPADYKLRYQPSLSSPALLHPRRSSSLPLLLSCRGSVRLRWQIINIHYILTKLSHKSRCPRQKWWQNSGRAGGCSDGEWNMVRRDTDRCSEEYRLQWKRTSQQVANGGREWYLKVVEGRTGSPGDRWENIVEIEGKEHYRIWGKEAEQKNFRIDILEVRQT